MNYRRAFAVLLGIIALASVPVYLSVADRIDAPPYVIAVATFVVVGGAIIALFPKLHDSTTFVRGLFSREQQTTRARALEAKEYRADLPSLKRNRNNLLANIHKTWVEGALGRLLYRDVLMELGVTVDPDAVSRSTQPWQLALVESADDDEILIPTEKPIEAIFAEYGRSLLILGAPGSGKTVTLLQLAAALVEEARTDNDAPIPVVLNLASWAAQAQPLEQWIADEVLVQYGPPPALTIAWLQDDRLTLLLDGLDEVVEKKRDACIVAINTFRSQFAAEIVVCSRAADYEVLSERLNLATAVRIKPLTRLQMHSYLRRFGDSVRGFREAIDYDANVRTLAESPLILSLVPITYAGVDREQITRPASVEAGRRVLFQRYVRQMFRRRPLPPSSRYDQHSALAWLHNLADGMQQHSQSIFYIERLQPTWLPTPTAQRSYSRANRLIGVLIWGLILGLIWGLIGGLIWGLIVGLIVGLIGGLTSSDRIELAENLVWRLPSRQRFFSAFTGGWLIGFIPPMSMSIVTEYGWGVAAYVSVPLALTAALALLLIPLWRLLNWDTEWLIVGLILGLTWGLILGLIWGLIVGLIVGLIGGLIWGLILGLIWGLILGLIFEGFSGQEAQERSTPNQSIRRSAVNGLGFMLLGALGGIIFGLVLWALDGTLFGLFNTTYFRFGGGLRGGLLAGVPTGVGIGFGIAFGFGLDTVVKHYVLRFQISRHRLLPGYLSDRRLITYLDTMTERIFLRRVGGGWQFIHRFLLEYFASLTPADLVELDRPMNTDSVSNT